jgi:hypothetical protein
MSSIVERISKGEAIVLSRKRTQFFYYATLAAFVLIPPIGLYFFYSPLPPYSFWEPAGYPYFYALLFGIVAFVYYLTLKNYAEVWIEGQKLHLKKIRGAYDVIPFASIQAVKITRQKSLKFIQIEYLNVEGVVCKAEFVSADSLEEEEIETILLVAREIYQPENQPRANENLELKKPVPIERLR